MNDIILIPEGFGMTVLIASVGLLVLAVVAKYFIPWYKSKQKTKAVNETISESHVDVEKKDIDLVEEIIGNNQSIEHEPQVIRMDEYSSTNVRFGFWTGLRFGFGFAFGVFLFTLLLMFILAVFFNFTLKQYFNNPTPQVPQYDMRMFM